jgi:Guanylate-binding protein, C-terminal domain
MGKLKHKVFTKARPKSMNGHSLNGCMLVELALSYVTALNNGEVPVIESAWTNVCQFEQ